jgi:hypothetical protein
MAMAGNRLQALVYLGPMHLNGVTERDFSHAF